MLKILEGKPNRPRGRSLYVIIDPVLDICIAMLASYQDPGRYPASLMASSLGYKSSCDLSDKAFQISSFQALVSTFCYHVVHLLQESWTDSKHFRANDCHALRRTPPAEGSPDLTSSVMCTFFNKFFSPDSCLWICCTCKFIF